MVAALLAFLGGPAVRSGKWRGACDIDPTCTLARCAANAPTQWAWLSLISRTLIAHKAGEAYKTIFPLWPFFQLSRICRPIVRGFSGASTGDSRARRADS